MLASQRHLRHIVFKETRIEPANRGKVLVTFAFFDVQKRMPAQLQHLYNNPNQFGRLGRFCLTSFWFVCVNVAVDVV